MEITGFLQLSILSVSEYMTHCVKNNNTIKKCLFLRMPSNLEDYSMGHNLDLMFLWTILNKIMAMIVVFLC